MTFASLGYLTFLLFLLPAYRWTPVKQRWILFLAASYYFYGCWNIKYSLLMLASTVFSFWGAPWVAPDRLAWGRPADSRACFYKMPRHSIFTQRSIPRRSRP